MVRRMAGDGSIFKRVTKLPDGRKRTRWVAQLSSGGREDRRYVTRTRRTSAEARAALADLRADRAAGQAPSTQSLGAYLRWWLNESARPSVSPNTLRGYEDVLTHLDAIADIPLARLTAEDIEAVCNRMTARKGHEFVPASPKTVRNAQIMLRRALGQAEARGHVRRNVAKLVPLRRVPRIKREALTAERARAILAAVAGDRYEAAFALALVGLREGEVLGLAWDDLRLEDPAVANVRYELVGSGRRARRQPPKSVASAAPVPLPPFVVERLRAHRDRQRAERPLVPLSGGLVFVTVRGYAVNGSWLTKHFQALLERAGLPRMRLHDLRHGAATLLAASGAQQRVAQELLRHATSRTTTEIYTHVSAAQQREAANLLEAAIGESVTESVTDPEHRVAGSEGG